MAAILAYIKIAVLKVLAFSEDLLRYVNDLQSGVLRHHYIIEFHRFFIELRLCQEEKKKTTLLWSRQLSLSLPNHGRLPKNEKKKTILSQESTLNLWNQKTIDLGFQRNTNSEFAEVSCLHA